jgi:hypothetical protein
VRLKKVDVSNKKVEESHPSMCIVNFCNRYFVITSASYANQLKLNYISESLVEVSWDVEQFKKSCY